MKTTVKNMDHHYMGEKINPIAGPGRMQEIWFCINKKGRCEGISRLLLEYLEDMDYLFFESLLMGDNHKRGLPPPVEFFKTMINVERESVFVEKIIRTNDNSSIIPNWNINSEGHLLRFRLGAGKEEF